MIELLANRYGSLAHLTSERGPYFISDGRLLASTSAGVSYEFEFRPLAAMSREGYPTETAVVEVPANGTPKTTPLNGDCRSWKHRYPDGTLCLWYPSDPPALRWTPEASFDTYLQFVSRHLQAEEHWRRTGRWPLEDAPHGQPSKGAWPIKSARMKRAARGEGR